MSAIQRRLPFALPSIDSLAVPVVCLLIFFLAYGSQYLFYYIEPGPLSRDQAIWFNIFVFTIWLCYDRACTVDPGPKGWVNRIVYTSDDESDEDGENERGEKQLKGGARWCKKCDAVKPPRAHHCKKCGRCIPKMDHHCPWTTNCVSEITFPHFIRFIFYAVLSMSILEYHLFTRVMVLWNDRSLPAYLGPSVSAMALLFVLVIVNSFTLFALVVLLATAIYGLAMNTTTIEGWEIERHDALVYRSRKMGGYVYANDGQKMHIEHQEFPYDIGIWKNLCQGMGTRNVLLWFFPLGRAPDIRTAGIYEVNGFEDVNKVWPPPDPDKMPRAPRLLDDLEPVTYDSIEEEKEAFRRRQQKDYERWSERSSSHLEKEYDS